MQRSLLTAVAIGCLSVTSALAQSAQNKENQSPAVPTPAARPPREPDPGFAIRDPAKWEKAAYLGVATSPAPAALRQQLGLSKGFGLMVDTVAPKSPAADAGLQAFDVLQKINDQLLVNPQQMAALVRSFKPGDTLKLAVFRQGKPIELAVTLIEREVPLLEELRLDAPAVPPAGALGQFEMELDPVSGIPRLVNRRPGEQIGLFADQFSVMMDDGNLVLQLSGRGGKQILVARDKAGKELFNGPIDTEEQRQAIPPAIRDKLPQISEMGIPGQRPKRLGVEVKRPVTQPTRTEVRATSNVGGEVNSASQTGGKD